MLSEKMINKQYQMVVNVTRIEVIFCIKKTVINLYFTRRTVSSYKAEISLKWVALKIYVYISQRYFVN